MVLGFLECNTELNLWDNKSPAVVGKLSQGLNFYVIMPTNVRSNFSFYASYFKNNCTKCRRKQGNKLICRGVEFLVCERKTTTESKSKNFLLAILNKHRTYISSLYETDEPDTFRFDFNGNKYLLIFKTAEACFKSV